MTEMVTVIIIVAILAAVALPRLQSDTFERTRFRDEALAALRYAHRSAVTIQRTVCVDFDGNSIILRYNQDYAVTTCPGSHDLPGPGGQAAPFTVTATGGGGFSAAPADFSFNRAGQPSSAQTLSLNGGLQIVIESETGFVR